MGDAPPARDFLGASGVSRMAKFQKKRAFVVSEDHEGKAIVVFAQHNVVARREGAQELNEEFEYVECRRAPEFDSFTEQGYVPRRALLAAGWWQQCHGPVCEKRLDGDQSTYILDEEDRVFCSHTCAGAMADYEAKIAEGQAE
jgi:hypothetical protein